MCAATGTAWLESQQTRINLPHTTVSDITPLFRLLWSTTDTSLIEVCELATYLRHFLRDTALRNIVKDLQAENKYDPTLLELAFAYRWAKAGADVELRPCVPKGEADFVARIGGLPFTVEVSGFPNDIFSTLQWRIPNIADDVVKSVLGKIEPFAVKIRLSVLPTGDAEQAIRLAVLEACRRLKKEIITNALATVSIETDFAKVDVERITEATEDNPMTHDPYKRVVDQREHDWTCFVRITMNRKPEDGTRFEALFDPTAVERLRVFVKMPPQGGDQADRLRKKFKKETSQLHGIAGPRIVILDVSALAQDARNIDSATLSMVRDLMRATPELACTWLVRRTWTTAYRFRYQIALIENPNSVYQLPVSFLSTLTYREWKWDFITEKELVSVSYEADLQDYANRHPI